MRDVFGGGGDPGRDCAGTTDGCRAPDPLRCEGNGPDCRFAPLSRATLSRSGGFAPTGTPAVAEISDAATLARMDALLPHPLPTQLDIKPSGCSDCYEYEIFLEFSDGRGQRLLVDDANTPDSLQPVVAMLVEALR